MNNNRPIRGPAGRRLVWLAVAGLLLATMPVGRAQTAVDGQRAMQLIKDQCAFGPRIPGTEANTRCREWIGRQFRDLGWVVTDTTYTVTLPLTGKTVQAHNIWAVPSADGPTSPGVLLSAHWDTRPFADNDPSGTNPPMLGANDGASGVALLIEIARVLKDNPLRKNVAIALWDAEDSGLNDGPETTWALGSQYAAQHPPSWIKRMRMGLNLDMIGGSDFNAHMEVNSLRVAPNAYSVLWRIGTDLYPDKFAVGDPYNMIDDHTPWNGYGVLRFIDLIGLPYKYWHTAGDSPEHCSAATLSAVGEVVMQWLHEEAWKYPVKPPPKPKNPDDN